MTITDDAAGKQQPVTFILKRNHVSSSIDTTLTGQVLTVTHGNVQQAIIATLKEALLHGNKVTVTYFEEETEGGPTGLTILKAVEILK